jgi:hypothetical protein
MPSALHHSFALEVMSWTYGHDRTGTASAPHLVGCAGRSHFALHSYAFTKYIIEVTYPCCYEALSLGYDSNWKSHFIFDIMSSGNSMLN